MAAKTLAELPEAEQSSIGPTLLLCTKGKRGSLQYVAGRGATGFKKELRCFFWGVTAFPGVGLDIWEGQLPQPWEREGEAVPKSTFGGRGGREGFTS